MTINYPLLLDGGLSNQLETQGCDLNHELWSAKLLDSNPETIVEAHLTYLKAGAQCLITASYQASLKGFMEAGFDLPKAERLILLSVELAAKAIERFQSLGRIDDKPLVAASIGPYGAYLADGSEYHGNYGISDEQLKAFHLPRIKLLDGSEADILACETIPCFQEAKVLAAILKETGKSAWMTFSCKDEQHLNDGTPITKCIELLENHKNIFAVGVNCTAPKYISGLIKTIKSTSTNKRIIVYPNSGEAYHVDSKTWLGTSDPYAFAAMAKEWVDLGAEIIGGCCRIGPNHIKLMNEWLKPKSS